jgi:hypothetical protein
MVLVAVAVARDDNVAHQPADLRDAEGYEVPLVVESAPFVASVARMAVK